MRVEGAFPIMANWWQPAPEVSGPEAPATPGSAVAISVRSGGISLSRRGVRTYLFWEKVTVKA